MSNFVAAINPQKLTKKRPAEIIPVANSLTGIGNLVTSSLVTSSLVTSRLGARMGDRLTRYFYSSCRH